MRQIRTGSVGPFGPKAFHDERVEIPTFGTAIDCCGVVEFEGGVIGVAVGRIGRISEVRRVRPTFSESRLGFCGVL